MQAADRAWIALGVGVAVWDIWCPPGQMLSEASYRYTQTHRLAWTTTVVFVAGHLLHVWGRRDPLTQLAKHFGR